MSDCVYKGERLKGGEEGIYECRLHSKCKLKDGGTEFASCDTCKQRLLIDDETFASEWIDGLEILDRRQEKTDSLRNLLAGRPAFLLAGGPSTKTMDLEQLNERGYFTLAINNSAGCRVRTQAFVCSDPPRKFSHSIWLDPQIMKFLPTPKMRGYRAKLRKKINGEFTLMERTVTECPNVWGFRRYSWLTPDNDFFLSDGACWGNHDDGCEKTGEPKSVCTMLLGLRLLRYLGASKVFLLGVDFRMSSKDGYSFNQTRDADAVASNNNLFSVVGNWLSKMQDNGVFERFGLEVYNCFEFSGLRAFPYVSFDTALKCAKGIVEREPDLAGWYDPEPKKEKKD